VTQWPWSSENYAAPEQWGKGQTDARSDVYALGATMYHLLANMAPTPAFLPSEPLPLGNYNSALSKKTVSLIEKVMARDRTSRFQSAPEMREALIEALPMPYIPPSVPVAPQVVAAPSLPVGQAARAEHPSGAPVLAPAAPVAQVRQQPEPARHAVPPATRVCPACGRPNRSNARFSCRLWSLLCSPGAGHSARGRAGACCMGDACCQKPHASGSR